MDQLTLAFTPPGIGHNQSPEAIDLTDGLNARLIATHAHLVKAFCDLELACERVPNPIVTEGDAASATDFVAQCQLHVKSAEAARKSEKVLFLRGGRAVDTFFKARCERLGKALAPMVARLKAYRDQVAGAERQRHTEAQERAAEEAHCALVEAEAHRARAERLCQGEQIFEERRDAPDTLLLADEAPDWTAAMRQIASVTLKPIRIRGNDGATAFVRRSWTFEVVDLDLVPREFMSLDVPVVREAITRDGIRHIPGLRILQTERLRVRAAISARSYKASPQDDQTVLTSDSEDAAKHQSLDQRPRDSQRAKRRGCVRSAPDPLRVPIKPIWGDQKVLRYYRQALASLQPHDAAEIAKFRAANAAIEARLWRKLPHRMEEIEFLYGGSRASPEAGVGTPK